MIKELTNEQIAAGAAIKGEDGKPVGRNTAMDVYDAMYDALPSIANKATEEGELPALPEKTVIDRHIPTGIAFRAHTDKAMRQYARAAIAADRASRQVANKAEVEKAAAWIDQFGNVFPLGAYSPTGKPNYLDADKRGWKPLFRATPPATTGASTAPTRQRIEEIAMQWAKEPGFFDFERNDFFGAVEEILREVGTVGASTAGLESILDRLEDAIGGYSGGPFDKVQAIIDELRAAPDCGACPGDGSMCKSRCKVEAESPASTVLTDERIDATMVKYSTCIAPGVYSLCSFEAEDDMRSFAREVAAQAGQVAAPEGWALVPPELTDSMRYAYERDADYWGRLDIQGYKAMIAAAPSPAKESK